MSRLVHFEVHADEPERAIKFYSAVFGWEFKKWETPGEFPDYWLIMTGDKETPGIDGGLMKRQGPPPQDGQALNAFPCTMDVKNLDEQLQKVEANGGKITVPKMPVPTVGWLAYCKDTEGNIFGLMQSDEAAK